MTETVLLAKEARDRADALEDASDIDGAIEAMSPVELDPQKS